MDQRWLFPVGINEDVFEECASILQINLLQVLSLQVIEVFTTWFIHVYYGKHIEYPDYFCNLSDLSVKHIAWYFIVTLNFLAYLFMQLSNSFIIFVERLNQWNVTIHARDCRVWDHWNKDYETSGEGQPWVNIRKGAPWRQCWAYKPE